MSVYVVRFHDEVTLKPTPALGVLLGTVQHATQVFQEDWIVTCGSEGHGPGDSHTLGEALDLSVSAWNPEQVVQRYHWLVAQTGPLFYVQYERPDDSPSWELNAIAVINPAASAPHIHMQRRKGTVYPPVSP